MSDKGCVYFVPNMNEVRGNEHEIMCEMGMGNADDSESAPGKAVLNTYTPMTTTLIICHNKIFYKMLL